MSFKFTLTLKINLLQLKGIDLIKTQLKDNSARLKREKTAIVGDVKPMIDILTTPTDKPIKKSVSFNLKNTNLSKKLSQPSPETEAILLSKKEQRETNLERENSKSIQKQSIRFKKAYKFLITFFNHILSYYSYVF